MSRTLEEEAGQWAWGESKLGLVSQIAELENEELGPKAGRMSSFMHYSIDTLTGEPQG